MRGRSLSAMLLAALLLAGCSTTRRLAPGEVLYTGVHRIRIEPDSGVVLQSEAEAAARSPLSVAPNNPLYAPRLRTPLPIGLWAYNYLYTPKERGFKYWLYRRLAKEPVLISKVQPSLRSQVAVQALENYGYFGSRATDSLLYRKRGRKARVDYTLRVAPPWHYAGISYPTIDGALAPLFDSLHATSLLREGAQYNLDTLTLEQRRITDVLRNRGYYYFRPDYLEYLADTTLAPRKVALRLGLRPGTPPQALRQYRIGRIAVHLTDSGQGREDTLRMGEARLYASLPLKIRPRLLERTIDLHEGELFTVEAQNRTLTALSRLGIFRSVSLNAAPDTLRGDGRLNVGIDARFEDPLEVSVETDVTSKSNSFLGPGITLKASHNNLFRGGEVLSLKLNGAYEWQTGNKNSGGRSSQLNSYELGLNASLDIPRLQLPRFLAGRRRYDGTTSYQLEFDLMNRPDFFRLAAFSASAGYAFRTSPHSRHALTLLKLTYNKLLHTTDAFDRTMAENPSIALSFRNQFVPSIGYTYTFEKGYGPHDARRLVWQNSLTSAGNILSGLLSLFGERQPQYLLGNRFSQFVKEVSELKFYQRVGRRENCLATRLLVGVGYAYGNSEVMPYSEQFYIGGANSIRAFTVRSIGPGSYRPAAGNPNGYLDQTGDFKLEANVEYRFAIMGRLGGAVFLDAGNVWLLKADPDRPGAELKWKGFFNEIALGTGFGLRYDISYLVIRADLGIGIHTPYPNPEKRGYYNISKFRDGLGFHLAIGYPF